MTRCCKVITTCFVGREVRQESEMDGDPPGLFCHAQNFPTPEHVLELVALVHELEQTVDPGIECDTIIVNNDVGWKKGNAFLASIDESPTHSGKFKVVSRANYGRSFGGYSRAFELFRDRYDYWLFTEDDILVLGDKYLRICIENLSRDPAVGFVALQGLSRAIKLHAHGGVGAAPAAVLAKVYHKHGKLPHRGRFRSQGYDAIVRDGEVAFTNAIHELGFKLATVESEYPLYSFAYDYMRGKPRP